MGKASREIFGRLNVKKAAKKYDDVITGTWEDTQEEGGIWNIDGRPDIQGYFIKSYETGSADLFVDSNGNLEADDGDLYVGFA
jgi:hypothetical protein